MEYIYIYMKLPNIQFNKNYLKEEKGCISKTQEIWVRNNP